MKRSEFEKRTFKADPTEGTFEVTVTNFKYWEDKVTGDIKGAFVSTPDYNDLFIPINDDVTAQLDGFLKQIGITSYDEQEINDGAIGQVIEVTMRPGRIPGRLLADFRKFAPSTNTDVFA